MGCAATLSPPSMQGDRDDRSARTRSHRLQRHGRPGAHLCHCPGTATPGTAHPPACARHDPCDHGRDDARCGCHLSGHPGDRGTAPPAGESSADPTCWAPGRDPLCPGHTHADDYGHCGRAGGGSDYHGDAWADGTRPRIFGQCGRTCGPTGTVSRAGCPPSPVRSDCLGIANPDENSVILVNGKPFRLNQVNLEVFDVVVIQRKPPLQGSVGNALLTLKQLDNLSDKLIILHGRCSTALASAILTPTMTHFCPEGKGLCRDGCS